jgi:hypothetical protein
MARRKFTPEEIEKTVESMNSISRAEVSPFFYTRVQARVDNASPSSASAWQVMMKPAVSLITLLLLLILNIAAIRYYTKASEQPVSETTSPIQKFANEYDLGTNSVYTDKTTK